MPRPSIPIEQKLVPQALRISPSARRRLESLPTRQKKRVLAAMRNAVELVINSMTDNVLQHHPGSFSGEEIKDNFLVDAA